MPENKPRVEAVDADDTDAGEARLDAVGTWGGEEPPAVEVTAAVDGVRVQVQLSPAAARRFGADLRTAATHAEQGAAERSGGTDD